MIEPKIKMKAPPKILVGTRVSADERIAIQKAADAACMSVDEFIRRRIFGSPVRPCPICNALGQLLELVASIRNDGCSRELVKLLDRAIAELAHAASKELET